MHNFLRRWFGDRTETRGPAVTTTATADTVSSTSLESSPASNQQDADAATTKKGDAVTITTATDALHFVVLQHGYHGKKSDMQYLAECLKAGALPHMHVLQCGVSFFQTDFGVRYSAERLVRSVVAEVQRVVVAQRAFNAQHSTEPTAPSTLDLHFHFVAHSMGGLVVRTALPALTAALEAQAALAPAQLHWDTLCCVATPHVGTVCMPDWRATAGYALARLSPSLADLFLRSPLLTEELLTPPYLACLRAFDRRVLVHACNDKTVMSYSAALHIPAGDEALLTGATAEYPEAPDQTARAAQGLPPVATSRDTMAASRWTLHGLTEKLWPPALLPRERALADALLAGGLAPVEVYTVDLRPAAAQTCHFFGRLWRRLWSNSMAHRAIVCEAPYNYPSAFGFVTEYICTEVLNVPLVAERVRGRKKRRRAKKK